jgi:hypothetical protein
MNELTEFGRLGRDYMDASAPKKRLDAGLTQYALAKTSGVSLGAIRD